MGRTPNYSVEQIEEACEALSTEGRYTVGNVRDRLGGGGYAYLARICLSWERKRRQNEVGSWEEQVPQGFRSALAVLVKNSIEEGRQVAEAERNILEARLSEALNEINRLDEAHVLLLADAELRQEQLDSLQRDRKDDKIQFEENQDNWAKQHGGLTHQISELERASEDARLHASAADERANITTLRHDEASAARDKLEAQLHELQQQHVALVRDAAEFRERGEQQSRLMAYLERDLTVKDEELSRVRKEFSLAQTRASAAEDRAIQINDMRTQDFREFQQKSLEAQAITLEKQQSMINDFKSRQTEKSVFQPQ